MRLVVAGRRRGEVNPICVASNARGGGKGGRERAFVVIANSITPYVRTLPLPLKSVAGRFIIRT